VVSTRVLSPEESIEMVRRALEKFTYIKVLGIAGPGEPLYNDETFETLRLAKTEFPNLIKCISTNGLLLPEKIDLLEKYDVGNVTVTWNALDAATGGKIYSWVTWKEKPPNSCTTRKSNAPTSQHRERGITMNVFDHRYEMMPRAELEQLQLFLIFPEKN
jgi:MoaA/NifB/PqqE/SkfB family radical SAM enzyme